MSKSPKFAEPTQLEKLRAEVAAVTAKATAADNQMIDEIIALARKGQRDFCRYAPTPAVMAILHIRYNPHNRDITVPWVRELARRMAGGMWQWNNEVPGFYNNGDLADAGHRFAAGAIADFTWDTVIVFGVDPDAIGSIDDGKKRHASDAAKLRGIQLAKQKETILKQATAYLIKRGEDVTPLLSITETATAMQAQDAMLNTSIEIAQKCREGVANPVLKETPLAIIAFLALYGHYPEVTLRDKLKRLNQGQSELGQDDPLYVAAEALMVSRKKADPRDRLTGNREIGVVLEAMNLTQRGIKAVKRSQLISTVKKELPSPAYPGEVEQQEAA